MKLSLKTALFVVMLCVSYTTYSQDLIERTQLGLPIYEANKNDTPNELAKLVQRSSNSHSRSTVSKISLFEAAQQNRTRFEPFASAAVLLNLKEQALQNLWKSKLTSMILKIPVNASSSIELELVQVNLFTEDFSLVTSDGKTISGADQQGIFYRGIVKGNTNSMAAVSIFEKNIRILVGDKEGNYIVGKLDDLGEHVLYNDRKLLRANPFSCGTTDEFMMGNKGLNTRISSSQSRNTAEKCIPIYVECDFKTYQDLGSSELLVNEYVASLVNESAILYMNEMINISLSQVKVWTSTDPYAAFNDVGNMLEKFGETIKDNYNGRLAHLISTRNLGGGIAWVDVLCSNYFTVGGHHVGPYAVSTGLGTSITSFPTYSWEVGVFTHEMGHNIASQHTQACVWNNNNTAIDGCAPTETNDQGASCARPTPNCPTGKGTIMSYCNSLENCGILFTNGFGPQPGALIRDRYNNASCVLSCAAPTCTDGIQNGDETGVDCGGTSCAACPCYESPLKLTILFDNFPGETDWTIKSAAGITLHQGGIYNFQAPNSTLVINNLNLADGNGYVFAFNDSLGDGICCTNENGQFTLVDNVGAIIKTGGNFAFSSSRAFCIGQSQADCPTQRTISSSLSSGTHKASQTITTFGTVNITGSVTFKAGTSISLNPGFHALSNSNFLATIEDCAVNALVATDAVELLDQKIGIAAQEKTALVGKFASNQSLMVFPNPTKNITTILYQLEQPTSISLSIYDLNGQLLEELLSGVQKQQGEHRLTYNTQHLNAGMFYLILRTANTISSNKLIIME